MAREPIEEEGSEGRRRKGGLREAKTSAAPSCVDRAPMEAPGQRSLDAPRSPHHGTHAPWAGVGLPRAPGHPEAPTVVREPLLPPFPLTKHRRACAPPLFP